MLGWPEMSDPGNGRPVSPQEFLARSHRVSITARPWDPTTYQAGAALVPLVGGSVTVDGTADVRRTCSLEVPPFDPEGVLGVPDAEGNLSLIPSDPGDELAPYGAHVKLSYAYSVPRWRAVGGGQVAAMNWSLAEFPLGVFRLAASTVDDQGSPTLSLDGYDLGRTIARNRFTKPWVIPAGTTYGDAMWAIVQDRFRWARRHPAYFDWPLPARATVPATMVIAPETDPWAEVGKLALAVGCERYFDPSGFFTLREQPDPSTDQPVWEYAEGDNAVLLGVRKRITDEPGFNGVVMTAEATTLAQPLRSEAWDADPASPTYYLGRYGEVPDFQTNPYVTTQAQCDAAARAALLRVAGGTEQLTMAAVPNASHEAGDVVRAVRGASRVDEVVLLDKIEIPLRAGDHMALTARARRTLS